MKQPIVVRAIQTCLQTNKRVVISSWQKNGNIKPIDTHCPTLTAAMGMGGGHTPMIIYLEEI